MNLQFTKICAGLDRMMGGLVGFSLKRAQIVTADKIINGVLVINHGKIAKMIEEIYLSRLIILSF